MAPIVLPSYLPSTRLESFLKKRRGAQKSLNWPFISSTSTLNPDQISSSGFSHIPTKEEPLKSTCYLCDALISNWIEGENVDLRHLEESKGDCPLAIIRNQSREPDTTLAGKPFPTTFSNLDHPKSDKNQSARLGTFTLGWPWEGVKGIPTKEEISSAGWYFRPGKELDENDQCVCCYCTRTVGGWEVGDDPM